MKVIIPVAGKGTRLKPHTFSLPKVLLQVAGKPILGHILEEIKKIGLKEVIFVVGDFADKIKEYVENNFNFKTYYVEQKEAKGLGHAIFITKDIARNEKEILIILGDTVFKTNFSKLSASKYSTIGVKEVSDARRFGVIQLNKKNFITNLIEKSVKPPTNKAIVGIYLIKNSKILYESLEKIINQNIRTKGEFQLTDALNLMVKKGEKMVPFNVEGWYDCGKPETILNTNKILLEKKNYVGCKTENSIIIPPVYIAKSAKIINSIIGPNVSIADEVQIKNCIIRGSIINANAHVENILINQSIIGSNALIIGRFERINLGDSSEIDLGYEINSSK